MSCSGCALADHVHLTCAFCELEVIAGFEILPDGGREGVVLHAMPPCKTYVDLTPDRFLAACRLKRNADKN